jgi:hypothetical protein
LIAGTDLGVKVSIGGKQKIYVMNTVEWGFNIMEMITKMLILDSRSKRSEIEEEIYESSQRNF